MRCGRDARVQLRGNFQTPFTVFGPKHMQCFSVLIGIIHLPPPSSKPWLPGLRYWLIPWHNYTLTFRLLEFAAWGRGGGGNNKLLSILCLLLLLPLLLLLTVLFAQINDRIHQKFYYYYMLLLVLLLLVLVCYLSYYYYF